MKLFVWDFHGVLEKDNEHAVVEVTNQVLEEFKQEARLSLELCQKLYGEKWSEFFRELCPKADQNLIVSMVNRGVEITNTTDIVYKHTKPTDFVHEVLKKIKKSGHENIILSNAEPEALKKYLDSVKITHLINNIMGTDSHRGSSNTKLNLLKEFLQGKKYDKIIAIGDKEWDIELGKNIGAVTYLFSKTGNFPETDADYKTKDLREVLKEI